MTEPLFEEFNKIARLSRSCTITEKLDGTNGCIYIADDLSPFELLAGRKVPFMVGSRTRWIFPEQDNYGFARWAYENESELLKLGPGRHFGEWWGQGIQRKYSINEKRFSLFNTPRWNDETKPKCCSVVPVLYEGMFNDSAVKSCIDMLVNQGSIASPGFMKPEGIVIWHEASRTMYKKTIEKDEVPKGSQ